MKVSELDFSYPESLVGLGPKTNSRVLWVESDREPMEVSWRQFLNSFSAEDLIVLNDTRVVPCRVFSPSGLDIAFLSQSAPNVWQVLTSKKKWPKSGALELPGGVQAKMVEGGRPQTVEVSRELAPEYFDQFGELAIPPYILKARGEQHMRAEDLEGYQTCFAEKRGSLAAPTASLHFKPEDLSHIKSRGTEIASLTLHVGLGTFLPVSGEDLADHKMHSEWIEVSPQLAHAVKRCRERGGKVWGLGTTVTRALESWALQGFPDEGFAGETSLMIEPGFEFQVIDVLMTNFHQPKSTLLALVMAFAGTERVKESYSWAIQRKFQLFSYGDLSIWAPPR